MPRIGPRCHERLLLDETATWRIVYRLDGDPVVVAEVFSKKTARTPKHVIDNCQRRLRSLLAEAPGPIRSKRGLVSARALCQLRTP